MLQDRLKGKLLYYYLALGEGYTARFHFSFYAPPPSYRPGAQNGTEIAALARTWDDRLRELFGQNFGAAAPTKCCNDGGSRSLRLQGRLRRRPRRQRTPPTSSAYSATAASKSNSTGTSRMAPLRKRASSGSTRWATRRFSPS